MNKKRLLSLLCFIAISAALITACGKTPPDNAEKPKLQQGAETENEFSVPKGVCEGEEVNIYLAMPAYRSSYIAEEENVDQLNDAVFRRNALVEEHTGANVNFTLTTTNGRGSDQEAEATKIRTLIQAGDDTYDAFIHAQRSDLFAAFLEDMFVNWYDIPYIELENPWWYTNVIRDSAYGGKLYAMTGDYNLTSFSMTDCLLFNKTMCDELGLDYPYQLVFDGEWTHERFIEYIKSAQKDINGDGRIEYTTDRYGFAGYVYEQVPSLFVGYGGDWVIKGDNSLPMLDIQSEQSYSVIDAMLDIFSLDGAKYVKMEEGSNTANLMFNEGRLLFKDAYFSNIPATRSLENIDVGFVPYPKLSKDQENYYSRTANLSGLTYIPVTNTNLEATGAVLETMAYFSREMVLDTYFDIILTIKSTRDVESEQMIPIIRNSSKFEDIITEFDLSLIVDKSENTLGSYIASMGDILEMRVDEYTEFYNE